MYAMFVTLTLKNFNKYRSRFAYERDIWDSNPGSSVSNSVTLTTPSRLDRKSNPSMAYCEEGTEYLGSNLARAKAVVRFPK
jgi:hypothetical protein